MIIQNDNALQTVHQTEMLGGSRHWLARAAARGALHRVRRGAYMPSDRWQELTPPERHLAVCEAVSERAETRPILSHWSAAAVHGMPIIGEWPDTVHRLAARASGGRSKNGVAVHATDLDLVDVVEVRGLLVTSRSRTVVDLAASASFITAVAAADHVLRRRQTAKLTKHDLREALVAAGVVKAVRRVERVIDFATDLADSPAESASRVNIHASGFEPPSLQSEFSDAEGFIGAVDFFWERVALIGEVDGRQKYLKEEYLKGRDPGQVVYEEKVREDRLRGLGNGVTRWDWFRATDQARLRAQLLGAGVPLRRARAAPP